MLLCALLAFTQNPLVDITTKLDALAKARDLEGLTQYLAPFQGRNPLSPIKTNGTYETGRFGWHAILLRMMGESFVVFTTPLTSEDVGELLFRFNQEGKLDYIPEAETSGQNIASHKFDIRFDLAAKKAIIK